MKSLTPGQKAIVGILLILAASVASSLTPLPWGFAFILVSGYGGWTLGQAMIDYFENKRRKEFEDLERDLEKYWKH